MIFFKYLRALSTERTQGRLSTHRVFFFFFKKWDKTDKRVRGVKGALHFQYEYNIGIGVL